MNDLLDILSVLIPELERRLVSTEDETKLPPSSFKLWFGDFNLVSLSDSEAVFTTPNPLRKSILNGKYRAVVASALKDILGFAVEVKILSEAEFSPESEKEEEEIPKAEPKNEPAETDEVKPRDLSEEDIAESITIKKESGRKSLIEGYTFDNFVEGSSNKFARAACMAVAREPNTYNPLFIYGHSGLGKTHLLYAVINYMKENHPDLNIVYKRCNNFLDELILAIRSGTTDEFKERYRKADVLLIDDVQFLAGKEQTQEEFFYTFSYLYEYEKQIILTSDRPPKEIQPLNERLLTRFEGGLLADVQPPSFELRIAIIKKKSEALGLNISNEIIEYMAERLHNNIRQIEGVLKKLYAVSSLTGVEVTKKKVNEIISIIDPGNIPTDALIERVLNTVSEHYDVKVEEMKSKKKNEKVAKARHVAIYLIRKLTDLPLKDIGNVFGRDHSTVISSIEKVDSNIKTINNYEEDIERMIKEIKG